MPRIVKFTDTKQNAGCQGLREERDVSDTFIMVKINFTLHVFYYKYKERKTSSVLIILTQAGVVSLGMWRNGGTVFTNSPVFHLRAPLRFHTSKVSFAAVASSVLVPSFMTCGLTFLLFTCSLHLFITDRELGKSWRFNHQTCHLTSMLAMSKFL